MSGRLYLGISFDPPPPRPGARVDSARLRSELEGLAALYFGVTPDIAFRGEEAIFLEVGRCLKLYPLERLREKVAALARSRAATLGPARFAQGRSIPEAWVRLRWGRAPGIGAGGANPPWILGDEREADSARVPGDLARVPLDSAPDWIDPLGERRAEHGRFLVMAERLRSLGVRVIGDLARVPPDSAASRFGEFFSDWLRALDPSEPFAYSPYRPPVGVVERVEFYADEDLVDLDPALFQIKPLLDRSLARLSALGRQIAKVELRLECERRSSADRGADVRRETIRQAGSAAREVHSRILFDFAFAQSDAMAILRLFREKLAAEWQRRPLPSPLRAIELEVLDSAPKPGLQKSFGGSREEIWPGAGEEAEEGWKEFVSQLAQKLSPRELFQAELVERLRPEKAWKKTLRDRRELAGQAAPFAHPFADRPLTLLDPPEPIHRLGRYLTWRETRYTLKAFEQRERLSGEWWEADGGFDRTYYRLLTVEGAELWIFRQHPRADLELPVEDEAGAERGGALFVHGVFEGADGGGAG